MFFKCRDIRWYVKITINVAVKLAYSDFDIVLYRSHCYVDFMSYYHHLTAVWVPDHSLCGLTRSLQVPQYPAWFADSWPVSAAPLYRYRSRPENCWFQGWADRRLFPSIPHHYPLLSAHGKSSGLSFLRNCPLRHRQTYPVRVYWFYWQVSGCPVACWWKWTYRYGWCS